MAVQYCEVCGVLVAGSSSICERCLQSRKVVVADSGSDRAPQRVQFACPTCQSLLQLAPVTKRTKIKCPKCQGEFALHPDGRIEGAGSSSATKKVPGAQENLLADLRPKTDLDLLLERVPEKKTDALPSVLQSEHYEDFQDPSSTSGNTAAAAKKKVEKGDGYAILPESTGPTEIPLDLVPDSSDRRPAVEPAPKPKAPPKEKDKDEPAKPKPRIPTARRSREQLEQARREKEARAVRAAEAQKYTIALLERKKERTLATTKLAALVAGPLLVAGLFLVSTTAEGGFAVKGPLGKSLAELGEVARHGAEGLIGLFK